MITTPESERSPSNKSVSSIGEKIEVNRAIEAILMVAVEPVSASLFAQLLEIPIQDVEKICSRMAEGYEQEQRGFVMERVAGGYRFQSHPSQASWIERFVVEGQSRRLTSASLETLAIVAYKQPISRVQISAIRGVDVEGVLRNLQQRGLICEVSRDPGPGNAVLYGTTFEFLEQLGIDTLSDLPSLGEFVPGPEVVEALERSLRIQPDEESSVAVDGVEDTAVG